MNIHHLHNTTPNTVEERFPSIISKYYHEDCKRNATDDESSSSSEEAELQDMAMLDMVVHVEDIQSQLRDVMDQYQKFTELTEIWHEKSAENVKNKYRVQWIKDESKKRKAMNKMAEAITSLQDELALLSLKSKDIFREHHVHLEEEKLKMEAKQRRRRRQQKQKKRRSKTKEVEHRHVPVDKASHHRYHQNHHNQFTQNDRTNVRLEEHHQHHRRHHEQPHKADEFKTTLTRQQVGNSRRKSVVAACA
mmetsp:Transcript_48738/g.67723  ORF Transcript_48738/g.67723 Transcript_48738/m.67723 type:complete len:249 (+) Transcript_48738:37-783(+)